MACVYLSSHFEGHRRIERLRLRFYLIGVAPARGPTPLDTGHRRTSVRAKRTYVRPLWTRSIERGAVRGAKRSEQTVTSHAGNRGPYLCRVASPCGGQADTGLSRRAEKRGGGSPDRARRLRESCQLTELASSGPHASSQRGPATGAGTCRSTQVRAAASTAPRAPSTIEQVQLTPA